MLPDLRLARLAAKDPAARRQFYEQVLGRDLTARADFIRELRAAVGSAAAYAAAKIGSEKYWMCYPLIRATETDRYKIAEYERHLIFESLNQSGIFPASTDFYLAFNAFFIEHFQRLDAVGLSFRFPLDLKMESQIVRHYQPAGRLIYYKDLQPDRSSPADDANCYLPAVRGKRLLLVCPFAGLLRARANKQVFEGVWSKTGKQWFEPASVSAVEFPYGFARETQQRFATAIELFDHIVDAIAQQDFDVALVAAGGLAVPLVSAIKGMGKVAIAVGGPLQILFGVIGGRWRERQSWQERYFNPWWIDMPPHYKPSEADVCDGGAYW